MDRNLSEQGSTFADAPQAEGLPVQVRAPSVVLPGVLGTRPSRFAAGDANNMWALLGALDDDTLRHLGPDLDVATFRQVLPLLAADPAALGAFASLDPEMAQLGEFADMLDQSKEQANSSMAEMRQVTEQMRIDSGVAEFETVLDQKLVRFNENVTLGEDTDAVIGSFVDELKRYLQDPTRFVLLDATMASLIRSLIDEGHVRLPERALSNASEAVLGTGILARLPAFPTAPLDKVVDLRRDLDEPLGRYRRKVSRLRRELRTGPFHQHVEAEVDAVWRTEVDPAIVEIRQAMADHGLVREILRSLSGNVSDFVKGVGLPAGVTVFSANMLDLSTAVTTGLAGTAASAPTVAEAVRNRQEGRAAARAHDLYYLYEVNRQLQP